MSDYINFDLTIDPLESFKHWFSQAQAKESYADAFSLATVDKNGLPSSRFVLVKEIRLEGLVFYTNYHGHKGQHLENYPLCALNVFWQNFGRQVSISGKVEKLSRADSVKYFAQRDRESQIASFVSDQSCEIENRESLITKFQLAQKQFAGKDIPCPEHWGGYLITPSRFEFFIYGQHRLNDRFEYKKNVEGNWSVQRLQP